jgi:Protein of unknown function (DUF550)
MTQEDWPTVLRHIIGEFVDELEKAYGERDRAVAAYIEGRTTTAIDALHIERQIAFSSMTFGPGPRTAGVLDHMRKEIAEVEANPYDLDEWVDLIILAIDGAWRSGHTPDQIIAAVIAKQTKNEARTWPDWRTADTDAAIEHDRSADEQDSAGPDWQDDPLPGLE